MRAAKDGCDENAGIRGGEGLPRLEEVAVSFGAEVEPGGETGAFGGAVHRHGPMSLVAGDGVAEAVKTECHFLEGVGHHRFAYIAEAGLIVVEKRFAVEHPVEKVGDVVGTSWSHQP